MRIKRQRRKLRGKYSGNCLSCSAKWSKCWYIASEENQGEWESRLSKVVTPGADEVCFQCWDAKIRTSPKRKMHFKVESPAADGIAQDSNVTNFPYLRPSQRLARNKRRALNEDYEYIPETPLSDSKHPGDYSEEECDGLVDENDDVIDPDMYEEGVIFEEENAVILLSTAFRTIPSQYSPSVTIDTDSGSDGVGDFAEYDTFDDLKSKKRGAYFCGKCGKPKKGHECDIHSPSSPLMSSSELHSPSPLPQAPLLAALQSQLPSAIQAPFQPQPADNTARSTTVTLLAQPVVS